MLRAWIAVVLGVAAVAAFAAPSARSGRDCTAAESRATFDAFVNAFNAGNRAALDGLVAPAPSFVWFSVSGAGRRLPPHRTMAALDRDGVIVHVTRSWEPSPPAWIRQMHPLRITRAGTLASFEGNTTGGRVSRWTGSTWRAGSYVGVWVLFGRPAPTAAQVRRPQAELDGAVYEPWRIGTP